MAPLPNATTAKDRLLANVSRATSFEAQTVKVTNFLTKGCHIGCDLFEEQLGKETETKLGTPKVNMVNINLVDRSNMPRKLDATR